MKTVIVEYFTHLLIITGLCRLFVACVWHQYVDRIDTDTDETNIVAAVMSAFGLTK